MTSSQILHALEHVNENYIAQAAPKGKRSHRRLWTRVGAAAACLCLCVGTLLAVAPWKTDVQPPIGAYVSGDGVTIPRMEVTLSESLGAKMDMIAFFIYDGRSYVAYELLSGTDVMGDYVGTSTGLIDEWTTADGYVDFAGSIRGDFYTVKGYDPTFMLCMPQGDEVLLYVNNNDMTLKTGADLYEQRLHLAGNYLCVEAETRRSWYQSEGQVFAVGEEHREVLDRFVAALYAAPFLLMSDIPLEDGQDDVFEREIYHMYFYVSENVPVHLRLIDGGYVIFAGLYDVCVQVDGTAFDALLEVLNSCEQ